MNPSDHGFPENLSLFDNSPIAFTVVSVLTDEAGDPRDFRFVYVNHALESLAKLPAGSLSGKTLFGNIFNAAGQDIRWLDIYARVVSAGGGTVCTDYSSGTDRHFRIQCYQPCANYCACFISDVSDYEKKIQKLTMEQETAKSNQILLDTIEYLPSNTIIFGENEQGDLIFHSFSGGFCRMLGCSKEEIWNYYEGGNVYERIHPDDVAMLHDLVLRSYNGKDTYQCTYRIMDVKGKYFWVSIDFKWFHIGEKRYLYVSYTNIDSIKAHEERLEKEYRVQESFTDSIADSYLLTMRCNLSQNRLEKVMGRHPLAFSGTGTLSYDKIISEITATMPRREDRENFLRLFNRSAVLDGYAQGKTSLSQIYSYQENASEVPIWVNTSMSVTQRPGTDDIIAFQTVKDINRETICRMVMDTLLPQYYDYIMVINGNQNTCFIICRRDTFADANGNSYVPLDILDYNANVLSYADFYIIEEDREAAISFMNLKNVIHALDQNGTCTLTVRIRSNGRLLYKKLDYYYIDRENRTIALLRLDITESQAEQAKQEERLRIALREANQASIAKTEFLSRMSHEIRTPMNAIIGLDTLALQEKELSKNLEDYLQKIGISARFLLSLINDILDMSRIESGRMILRNESFNFEELIDNINTIFYEQCRDCGLEYECVIKNRTEETYIGDGIKLQQVLVNILGNAVKFTPKGGKIHFMAEQLSRSGDRVRMRFEISDTGIGIDEKFMPQIFDPFVQEERGRNAVYGGTGLGLAISRSIVNLMGGDISVHSVRSMGSDFIVEIELGLSEDTVKHHDLLRSARIHPWLTLIVDDDVIVCRHTQVILRESGLNAEWTDSGAGAVKLVKAHHSDRKDYDLILVDWKMPDMDGTETVREIRKIVGPETTIIIMTAYDWTDIEKKALDAGADMFMKKPVFASSVLKAFENVFLKKSTGIKPESPQAQVFDFTGRRVLLAEDNRLNALITKELLEKKNFTVDTAVNGAKAVEMFDAADAGYYDAILMDVRMPVIDGLEATRTIRAMGKPDSSTIPIIAMTANAFQEDIHSCLEAGMNAHLAKPIETPVMYRTLEQFICSR